MAGTLYHLLQLVDFMSPAYAANMAPPFVKYWRGWNPPIARRSLGTHKTVLGFASGVAAAVLVTWLQSRIVWDGRLVDADTWLGVRFGVGAMAGDCVKSFGKRRAGIPPGAPWMPFDQIDFVIGALLLTWSRAALSWLDGGLILAMSAVGHVLVNHLGYWLGIRASRW